MSIVERALAKAQQKAAELTRPQRTFADNAVVQAPVATPTVAAPPEVKHEVVAEPVRRPRKRLALDLAALRDAGMLAPADGERRLVEEYRRIKRPIVARALARTDAAPAGARIVMVASALPNEGKTFTSLNLALSLALEKDLTVLLVDADIAKGHLSALLGLQGEPGFLDALRDETIDIEDLIFDTDFPKLSVISAGTRSETDTELLASRRMTQLTASLVARDSKRVAILDSPPLLLTNDSRELVNAVDQVVLVVRAGETSRQAVVGALDAVGDRKPVALVLTHASPSESERSYYGYGSYAEHGTERET